MNSIEIIEDWKRNFSLGIKLDNRSFGPDGGVKKKGTLDKDRSVTILTETHASSPIANPTLLSFINILY